MAAMAAPTSVSPGVAVFAAEGHEREHGRLHELEGTDEPLAVRHVRREQRTEGGRVRADRVEEDALTGRELR
jgi:hypothetical protein